MILVEKSLQSPDKTRIPVAITTLELSRTTQGLAVHAGNQTKLLTPDPAPAFDANDLNDGAVVLLIDGLDEVADATKREAVMQKIADFRRTYSQCQVIIASRDYPFVDGLVHRYGTRQQERVAVMPRQKRTHEAGSIYHALNRGNARQAIIHNEEDYEAFLRVLAEGWNWGILHHGTTSLGSERP